MSCPSRRQHTSGPFSQLQCERLVESAAPGVGEHDRAPVPRTLDPAKVETALRKGGAEGTADMRLPLAPVQALTGEGPALPP